MKNCVDRFESDYAGYPAINMYLEKHVGNDDFMSEIESKQLRPNFDKNKSDGITSESRNK